ncbi:MAG: hypothetical protein IJY28_09080 [Clostridia bacterium]|nr:hypothetical protein [Clostridia bacterium]
MSIRKSDHDFFDDALRQIHQEARQGIKIPEQTALRRVTETVRSVTSAVTEPLRKYIDHEKQYMTAAKAEVPPPPVSAPSGADDSPVRATPPATETEPSKNAKTAVSRKFFRTPGSTDKQKKKAPRVKTKKPARTAKTTTKSKTPHTGQTGTAPTARPARRHNRNRSPMFAIMLTLGLMLTLTTGLWLIFGYRSAEATVTRYAQAFYKGDSDTVYSLYDQQRLKTLALYKKFNNVDEFLTSERERFSYNFANDEKYLGKNFTIKMQLEDQSEKYQLTLDDYAVSYEIKYDLTVHEMRWYMVHIQLDGSKSFDTDSFPLVLARIGTWWYVVETPSKP